MAQHQVDNDFIFFQSTKNILSYYIKNPNSPTNWWEVRGRQDKNPHKVLNNCAGYISVDDLERVWYKGTDGYLYAWDFLSGFGSYGLSSTPLPSVGSTSPVVVAKCGCLAFYIDIYGNLRQKYWWGQWHDLPNPVVNIYETAGGSSAHVGLRDELILDEANGRVYLMGENGSLYYYSWTYSAPNAQGLVKLTNRSLIDRDNNNNTCTDYPNGASQLAFGSDRNALYYKSTEGDIWYSYNDRENNTRSFQNWNKTPLMYGNSIQGSITQEAGNFGRLFYVGSDSKMYKVDWVSADNPIVCNANPTQPSEETSDDLVFNKTDMSDTVIYNSSTSEELQVLIHPNPSQGSFTFSSEGGFDDELDVAVYDINGRPLYSTTLKTSAAKSSVTWNAENIAKGLYFFSISSKLGGKQSGKLVKL